MKTDYQFLIGRDFCVGDNVYTIRSVAWMEENALVEANMKSAEEDGQAQYRFPVGHVLQWLLVEEEIELCNPKFLRLAGS